MPVQMRLIQEPSNCFLSISQKEAILKPVPIQESKTCIQILSAACTAFGIAAFQTCNSYKPTF